MDQSTLQCAADRWGRSQVVEPNAFQALEDLTIHSNRSRVVAWWMRLGKKAALRLDRIEDATSWLCAQDHESWKATVIRLCQYIHPEIPSNPEECGPLTGRRQQDDLPYDEERQNHINFCAHVEVYLQLKHAIKFADIGLLRCALRECALIFQGLWRLDSDRNAAERFNRVPRLTSYQPFSFHSHTLEFEAFGVVADVRICAGIENPRISELIAIGVKSE